MDRQDSCDRAVNKVQRHVTTPKRYARWSLHRLRLLQQRNLRNQFLEESLAKRVVILRHDNERSWPADDVVTVVFLKPARRICVLGIPGRQNDFQYSSPAAASRAIHGSDSLALSQPTYESS